MRENTKTIFLTCTAGQEVRNWLYGDFYRIAQERDGVCLVVFVSPQKLETYRQLFSHERCIVEPIEINMEYKPKKFFRIACFGCVPTITIWSRNWFSYLNGGSLINFWVKQLFWYLGHLRAWRCLMRAVEYYAFHDDKVWKPYFEKYQPDVVFGSGLLNEEDITLVKYAKRVGVPSVGMMRSWDNFTSKGFLRVPPDILFVQNPTMVEEVRKLNNFPSERVRIVGFPQWDNYLNREWHIPKEEFAARFGIDPKKRWIAWFGGGLLTGLFNIQDNGDHIMMIDNAIQRGEIKNAQVLARVHPGHEDSLRPEARKVAPVLNFGKGWNFDVRDIKLLLNLVRLSDVTINLGSTMALEAAIFDKPVVLVGFNGYADDSMIPWSKRLSTALDNTFHYHVQVEGTGGVWRVTNEKELIEAVKTYLENPALHREGRARIVRELVGPVDGGASRRALNALLSAV